MKNIYYKNLPVRKRFGQNFLVNDEILEKIAELSDLSDDNFILEIGAGHGYLTDKIVNKVKKLVAIEIDRDLVNVLNEKFSELSNIEIISDNFLKFDLNTLKFDDIPLEKRKVIGNIPYNITSDIILKLLKENVFEKEAKRNFSEIIIMVQKEVAEKIMAKAGSKNYGSISVISQYASNIKELLEVSGKHFYPSPKVDSTVISFKLKDENELKANDNKTFLRLVHSIFISRRKNLKNSLKIGSFTDEQISNVEKVFDLNIRGEQLSIDEIVQLSNLL